MSTRNPESATLVQLARHMGAGEMTRTEFLQRAVALGLSMSAAGAILAACGESGEAPSASGSPTALDTALPKELLLYNWSDYMAPELKKSFEREYGIKVVESYYDGNEMLLSKLSAGATGYDLCVPDNITVHIMLKSGLIQPLDMSLIPNFANVMPQFKKPNYDPEEDGKKYSIPFQWGTTGIGLRKDLMPETTASWNVLFDPKNKGRLTMLDDPREVFGVALKIDGNSLNSTDEGQVDAARDKLIAQKPLVRAYDSVNTKRNLISGLPMCHAWNGYVLQAYDVLGPEKLEYVLPEEGFAIWCDNIVIPVGAPSPYAAHLFMNYLYEPANAAKLVDYTWFSSPVPAAEPLSNPIVWEFVPSEETLQRSELLNDVAEFKRYYDDAWMQVKSS